MADGLTPKQASFVREYLKDHNGKQAAIRTGYSPKSAEVQASVLLSNPKVAAHLAALAKQATDDTVADARRTLQEMTRLAMVDIRSFYTEDGKLKRMQDLTAEQGAALCSVETLQRNATAGDGQTETVYKLKMWDKTRALEMLAKHHKLLTDIVQVSTDDERIAMLLAGRKHARVGRD